MPTEYPAAFRQRVLRRVAETDDLGATAREFGLSADLVFLWVKEDAEGSQPSALPLATSFRPERESTSPGKSWNASDGGGGWLFYTALFVPLVLWTTLGHVHPSARAWRDCLPIWIALGVGLFFCLSRTSKRALEVHGIDLPAGRRRELALVFAALSGLSASLLAFAFPAIPHWLISKPVEVRTIVNRKVVYYGKHTAYCLGTPAFYARIDPFEWCTSRKTFEQAKEGDTIILHGTTSWFGFKDDHFDLAPPAPASAPGVAKAGLAVQAPPATVRSTAPVQFQGLAPIPQATRTAPASVPPAPIDDARAPAPDEPLRAWPGDDLAKIQVAYPDHPAPAPFNSPNSANRQMLWLRDRGIMFFLTSGGTINVVRLDKPFAGMVDGIRLGDRLDEVRRKLGSPGKDLGMPANGHLFATDAGYRIRVDLGAEQRVLTIFLIR